MRGTDDLDIVPDPSADNLKRLTEVLEDLDGRVVGDRVLTSSAIKTFLRTGDKTLVRTSRVRSTFCRAYRRFPGTTNWHPGRSIPNSRKSRSKSALSST